jgi:transposase InsO family protein
MDFLDRQLISDRDNMFTSKLWQSLMQKLHVTCAMSSAYRPQTDGQTERVNRVLEDMLRHFIDPAQSNWDKLLPLVEFAINDSYHESMQAIPFVLNYGKRGLYCPWPLSKKGRRLVLHQSQLIALLKQFRML